LFSSKANNLVPHDTNSAHDVFVHDRMTGRTVRASESADGLSNGPTFYGSISRDGRYVAFYSFSNNLIPIDTNGRTDIFRKDLLTGEVELVSVGAGGEQTNGSSIIDDSVTAISPDGRYVVYQSLASNIVPGTPPLQNKNHLYLRDMVNGTNELISVGNDGTPGDENHQTASISNDGNVVVFETRTAYDPQDSNGVMDVYARNRAAGTTEWVSVRNDGTSANNSSWRGRPNHDGSIIVFDSSASIFVPRDQGGTTPDVFLRDMVAKRTEKVSVSATGAPPNGVAYRGTISADGRFVSFWSSASNFDEDKTTSRGDIYVHDRLLGTTERVSVPRDGGFGNNTSQLSGLSADGTSVAFMSWATNLTPEGANGKNQIYARTFGPPLGLVGGLHTDIEDESLTLRGMPRVTGTQLVSEVDPTGDLLVEEAGVAVGDITSASLAYRTQEQHELLFRVLFGELPQPAFRVAAPGPVYGVSFDAGGARYEIRMNAAEDVAIYPRSDLYRCAPVCIPVALTEGGFGTAGHEIHFGLKLEDAGLDVDDELTNIRAFAGIGSSQSGALAEMDALEMGSASLPAPSFEVALAPAGIAIVAVEFRAANVADGELADTFSLAGLPAGDYLAWSRICLGDSCGYDRAPVRIGDSEVSEQAATSLVLTLVQERGEVRATAALMSEGVELPGKQIVFELNGVEFTTASTDAAGRVVVTFHRNQIKKGDVVTARFSEDENYLGSESRATMTAQPPGAPGAP
jgi:hypothetical protein